MQLHGATPRASMLEVLCAADCVVFATYFLLIHASIVRMCTDTRDLGTLGSLDQCQRFAQLSRSGMRSALAAQIGRRESTHSFALRKPGLEVREVRDLTRRDVYCAWGRMHARVLSNLQLLT